MSNVTWHDGHLSREERWAAIGQAGATIWLTGLSGSGKSTIAAAAEARLLASGRSAYLLDGDNLRHGLNADLGFSDADRAANVARVAQVARLFADAGTVALVSLISPFREGRDHARTLHEDAGLSFYEVWVDTPFDICRERDPKGLYARAEAGEISGFTGVDSPYEEPGQAELVLRTHDLSVDRAVDQVLGLVPGVGSAGTARASGGA